MATPQPNEGHKFSEGGGVGAFLPVAARLLITGVGGLYTVGLVIVNIDLGQYGVFNLDLARPEYVMAGALWLLAVLPFALLGIVHLDQAQEWWRNGLWRLATLEIVLCVFSATFLPALLLLPLSPIPQNDRLMGGLSILLRHMLVATANGFATVVVLRSLGRMILRMPAGREWHRRTLQVGTVATLVGPFLIVLLLLYASISFPLISRGFGGGKKAVVEVVLARPAPESWNNFPVPISADRSVIGPVFLLFESQGVLVVAQPLAPALWPPGVVGQGSLSVTLERSTVAAIVYKSRVAFYRFGPRDKLLTVGHTN